MKAKTDNLKWYLFPWNFKAFKSLFTYIYHFLVSLSVLFKHKSFFLLTWVCSSIAFQYFGWEIFTSYPNFRGQPWRCEYLDAKLAFIAGFSLKKYPWYMKIHFQFHFFCNLKYISSVLPITAWKAPASSWSPSEVAMFFNIDPRCFESFGKL